MTKKEEIAVETILCALARKEIYLSTAMEQIKAIWPKEGQDD